MPGTDPENAETLITDPLTAPWATKLADDAFGRSLALNVGQARQIFRWIEPGRFLMGSPTCEAERGGTEALHEVKLSQGFWLADTVCTQTFWMAVWPDNPSHFPEHGDNPVENVSWHDAMAFITELNRRLPGLHAHLPSEAQWEYACRAGTTTAFSFGDTITPEQVNHHGNYPYADGDATRYRQRTVPAGSLPPNPWGLYEMHGNVWEWCSDWYAEYPAGVQIDPQGPTDGTQRTLRGGTWSDPSRYARSANRSRIEPAYRPLSSGFRIALNHR